MLELLIDQVIDPVARENFLKVSEFIKGENILLGQFKFYEIIFTQAEVNKKIPHGLGFRPKDIIQTSRTGVGDILWHYDLFDATNIEVSTSDACTIRAFIGNYASTGA